VSVQHVLRLVEIAIENPNITINSQLDPQAVVVHQSTNAKEYYAILERRLSTYSRAIEQRGFSQVAGEYSVRSATFDCKDYMPPLFMAKIARRASRSNSSQEWVLER
jgi:hypothetical protein